MSRFDARDCSISGATDTALDAYERALDGFLGWRGGVDLPLALAREKEPGFVMAHVLQAWRLLCSREPQRVRAVHPVLAHAAGLPANERERRHLSAIAALVSDDFDRARAGLAELLRHHPHDVLALHAAQSFAYLTGDAAGMHTALAAVLPAWSRDQPGYHAVLAMQGFALVECGDYPQAERAARAALELDPLDARAHHTMAHVFEMTGQSGAGARWMVDNTQGWATSSAVVTHGWWHVALFHLTEGDTERALALYDQHIRADQSSDLSDLIDATSLLWRIQLQGGDTGRRGVELVAAWGAHIDDRYCSFSDLHAMLAFVGAGDWDLAQRLQSTLAKAQSVPTRHGLSTREIGLPACRALMAFGRGDYNLAIPLLASLPALAHRLGGSHAQRDVLHLTLQQAVEHIRRPARRPRAEPVTVAAPA